MDDGDTSQKEEFKIDSFQQRGIPRISNPFANMSGGKFQSGIMDIDIKF